MSHRIPSTHSRHQGFSLVEVLVAIVILAFGLLGMVGLQLASLQANRDARLQSVATGLARELAEMMRGNKSVALAASGNSYLGEFATGELAPAAPNYCLAAGSSCADNGAVAAAEMTEWLFRVDSELPGARVSVCRDTAPYDAEGLPQWDCSSELSTDPVVIKIGWARHALRKGTGADESGVISASKAAPAVVLVVTPGSSV